MINRQSHSRILQPRNKTVHSVMYTRIWCINFSFLIYYIYIYIVTCFLPYRIFLSYIRIGRLDFATITVLVHWPYTVSYDRRKTQVHIVYSCRSMCAYVLCVEVQVTHVRIIYDRHIFFAHSYTGYRSKRAGAAAQ